MSFVFLQEACAACFELLSKISTMYLSMIVTNVSDLLECIELEDPVLIDWRADVVTVGGVLHFLQLSDAGHVGESKLDIRLARYLQVFE